MASARLECLIKLKYRLDLAYEKQNWARENELRCKSILDELTTKRVELEIRHDQLYPQKKSRKVTGCESTELSRLDVANMYSKTADYQYMESPTIFDELADNKFAIATWLLFINQAAEMYRRALADYDVLYKEFESLIKDNREWSDWINKQNQKIKDVAEYASVPEEYFDTVVIKTSVDNSFRVYFGKIEKVYGVNDICRIIHENGAVYHRDEERVCRLIKKSKS